MLSYHDSMNQSKIDTIEIISLYNALLKYTLVFHLTSLKKENSITQIIEF